MADTVAALLLASACVAAPLALGATGAWTRFATEAAMGSAAALWAATRALRARTALAPLAVAGLLAMQLVPLPDQLLAMVSPVSAAAWKVSQADIGSLWGRITVDPATTAAGIRRLLLAAATLVAVVDLGRKISLRRLLCGTLCVVCVTIWALGLAFPFDRLKLVVLGAFDRTGPIKAEFWKTPIEPPIATNGSGNLEAITVGDQRYQTATWIAADAFGPYVYSNHFAGGMCLTLPVLLGVWMAWSKRRVPDFVRGAVVAAVFAGGLWTVGVMATSRAGAAALVLAALVFACLSFQRPWLRRTAYAMTAAYALAVAVFTVAIYGGFDGFVRFFPASLQPRVASLMHDGRAISARAALRMFGSAPLFGSGLGTYGELFTRFLRTDFLLHFAHNDYAQWLAETGLMGASLAIAFATALARSFWRWHRTVLRAIGNDPLTAGLWAALAGIGVHTAYDWNLHIPANALLACVVAGLAIAVGTTAGSFGLPAVATRGAGSRGVGFVLAVACLLAVGMLARDAASDDVQRDLRTAIVKARLAASNQDFPSAAAPLRGAIAAGEKMMAWDSANGNLAVLIGLCQLHLSAELQAPEEKSAARANADRWFAVAKASCATVRGLPEVIPPGSRKP